MDFKEFVGFAREITYSRLGILSLVKNKKVEKHYTFQLPY